jgi:hypothetical protein
MTDDGKIEVPTVSPEDLKRLRELQQTWELLTKRYGELHYEKKMVDAEMRRIDEGLDELEANRVDVVTRVQSTFGKSGTVNLQTGEFLADD